MQLSPSSSGAMPLLSAELISCTHGTQPMRSIRPIRWFSPKFSCYDSLTVFTIVVNYSFKSYIFCLLCKRFHLLNYCFSEEIARYSCRTFHVHPEQHAEKGGVDTRCNQLKNNIKLNDLITINNLIMLYKLQLVVSWSIRL